MFIHIEGNIGAGKSTLLRFLGENIPCNTSQEPVQEWMNLKDGDKNLLDKFYNDIPRWSFAFQMNCFITRAHNVKKLPSEELNFIERSILSDRIFAKNCFENGTMEKIEYDIYTRWSNWLKDEICEKIDAIIYLRSTPNVSMERINKRSRQSEDLIPYEYINQLHLLHDDWLDNEDKIPILFLDADNLKFDNNLVETVKKWVKEIEK